MSKTAIVYPKEFEESLRENFRYDMNTGFLYYTKTIKGRRRSLTDPAGSTGVGGYLQLTHKGIQIKGHRLAWFLFYGSWPSDQIDHINKDKLDNRIDNLRVGASVNQHNREIKKASSGLTGAHKSNKAKSPFKSSIRLNGRSVHLGYFKTPEEASAAYLKEKEKVLAYQ